ncbi:MAG: hypothetical protein BWX84_02143 [Verrucomicrobia bacterium ADurb.Bin118]|nr:MAG: hypothetical protein BWX84_02143 [Verrucomicrobia bacterium ADurb.Bin118]
MPQRVVIIEVFVTGGQAVDPLADQRQQRMLDPAGLAWIGQHLGQRLGQANPPVRLAQQRNAAIASHLSAGETGLDGALFYGWKSEEFRVTNCPRRSGVVFFHLTQ